MNARASSLISNPQRTYMREILVAALLSALTIPSLAADASERKFIDKGMTESEVL